MAAAQNLHLVLVLMVVTNEPLTLGM